MKARARAVVVLGGAALALAGRHLAFGSEADSPVRIEFAAPAGCPDAAEFGRRIEGRTSNMRRAADGEKARVVRGEIEPRGAGVVGRLVLVDTDGETSERTLEAGDCRQATDALALIAALAIDRRAAETSAPAASSAPSHPAPPPAPSQSERPATPPSTRPAAPAPAPPRQDTGEARQFPVSFQATAAGFGTLGMAPGPTAGGALLLGVLFDAPRPPWSWSIRAGVAGTADRSFDEPGGTAAFRLLTGVGEICPLALHLGRGAWLRPCAQGEYGVVHVGGSRTTGARSLDRPWGGAGVDARFAYRVAGPFWLDATVGGLVALQRNAFEFGDSPFFESPTIVGRALVGAGAVWP